MELLRAIGEIFMQNKIFAGVVPTVKNRVARRDNGQDHTRMVENRGELVSTGK